MISRRRGMLDALESQWRQTMLILTMRTVDNVTGEHAATILELESRLSRIEKLHAQLSNSPLQGSDA